MPMNRTPETTTNRNTATSFTRGGFAAAARALTVGALATVAGLGGSAQAQNLLVNFETPPVHAMDLSPDGLTLGVANLPDGRVEFFDMAQGVPLISWSVAVGVDPVTVRFRTNSEAWVVNNISDTISVVDITNKRVKATYNTLDEPNDVVFVAGSPQKAYVSCSEPNTIQVLNAGTGVEIKKVLVNMEEPRALALSADGTKVYAASFTSGNGSTLIGGGIDTSNTLAFPPNTVSDASGPYAGVNPPPNSGAAFNPPQNGANPAPPKVALIVKKNASGNWMDDNNHNWTDMVSGANAAKSGRPVGWDLADRDLAVIDTGNNDAVTYATRLMNICMGVGVNPANGLVYVIGTDAINEIRFEPNVNGVFVRVKLGIVNPAGPTTTGVFDLNPHLNYSVRTVAQSERDKSIGDPRGIVWNAAGTRGYVSGMGSNNLIVIDAAGARIAGTDTAPILPGQGPSSLVLDEARNRLYILNRFDQTVGVRNATTLAAVANVSYFDPTPAAIRNGRPFFYETHRTSGLGQLACASCHVDGKMDRLAWDLGDPSGAMASTSTNNDMLIAIASLVAGLQPIDANVHPMKGPMTTQTFQDIIGKEPLHWRGDRTGLEAFNGAFTGLQGDDVQLTVPAKWPPIRLSSRRFSFRPIPSARSRTRCRRRCPCRGTSRPAGLRRRAPSCRTERPIGGFKFIGAATRATSRSTTARSSA